MVGDLRLEYCTQLVNERFKKAWRWRKDKATSSNHFNWKEEWKIRIRDWGGSSTCVLVGVGKYASSVGFLKVHDK